MSDPFDLSSFQPAPPAPPPSTPPAPPPWLEGLNPEQRQAVETTDGPLLVLSGAGTGKTRVLTTRLAYLLHQRLARPWEIMAVTFTNRAAREMRERVGELIGPPAEQLWLGTFHALGARLLRRHAELVDLKSNFTILDADDQLRLLKQLMQAANLDPKRSPPPALMGCIQRWKDRGLTPEAVPTSDRGAMDGFAHRLYGPYQERLKTLNTCDFGDLLLHCLTVFKSHPEEALQPYQQRLRYILVDEYQDTNVAQYLWLRLLAQGHRNLCCVGDDDQSIYSWRGAEVGNILRFEQDFPGANVIRLERNYRSTPRILAAASELIANNRDRLGKTLKSGHAPQSASQGDDDALGERLRVRAVWDGEEEARVVAEDLIAHQRDGGRLSDAAILVRTGAQTREFEERLMTTGLPYRVVGGPRFYERLEIRDAVAYLRLIAQADDDMAFERIVNKPRRGIGDATLKTLHQLARAGGLSLSAAATEVLGSDELKPRAAKALDGFLQQIAGWREVAAETPPGELMSRVLKESGLIDMWRADPDPQAPGRVDNLRELCTALEDFESLETFLEHVSLVMENEEAALGDRVTLMTLHGAKGLEFELVFLAGWEEELFPHRRALDQEGLKGLEEERRLAYVGLTRARRRVTISHAANRRLFSQWQSCLPSRFLDELPDAHVVREGAKGLSGGRAGSFGGGSGLGWDGPSWARPKPDRHIERPTPTPPATRPAAPDGEAAFSPGQRVFHDKFGYGTVTRAEGGKLDIQFEKGGAKKVMARFVVAA
ncbi:ATP-dependent helicase [Roseospirillum parvum]|uniref:DNA 3'-5' helicase n=1 Tax=Roseospirillum parvum TaxID=83401 RepID=A0A1G7TMT7_9PROT|nr:UvrD-helicase domain-containing protein [Roseospirillum parvum]SDG36646.1 DNA helicase-2 / ATP-dependent DNA helicase PcrA [Roseospirillum parvum]